MQLKATLFSISFLFLAVFAGNHVLSAQVSNSRLSHSRGNNDALVLELPSAEERLVKKLWPDWLKDTYDVRTKNVKKGKGELQSLNFAMPGVSPGGRVDLYSSISKTGKDGSELIVWIATPDGYVSPAVDENEYYEAEKALMRFALAVSRRQVEMDVDEEEDALEDLQKELTRLQKDKDGYEKDIRNAERAIEEARAKIERNLLDQENKALEIERQTTQVAATKRRLEEY